jgi:hypothetical protein
MPCLSFNPAAAIAAGQEDSRCRIPGSSCPRGGPSSRRLQFIAKKGALPGKISRAAAPDSDAPGESARQTAKCGRHLTCVLTEYQFAGDGEAHGVPMEANAQ